MYNQFNNRKDWQLREGERVYFNFRQKNYVRRELFNCENEYSGNPALVWWRNFWQMEGSGGMGSTHRLVWWLPGGGCASGSRSRTLTWFVLLETCRESFSESDLLQEAGYTQNIFKMRKKLFLVWGRGSAKVTWLSGAITIFCPRVLLGAVLAAFTSCSMTRTLLELCCIWLSSRNTCSSTPTMFCLEKS